MIALYREIIAERAAPGTAAIGGASMSETSGAAGGGIVTAALLVIGDEILSGRTKDKNIGHIADHLTAIGIQMKEVRVVPDEEPEIVDAVNALRKRYNYVFTTGGIGPTHDDITADAIAKAFGVGIDVDERALAPMKAYFERRGVELTPARLRMARIPFGAELVENSVSIAPGFMLGNVIVMAGVPNIMHVMLDAATKFLKTGKKMLVLGDRSAPARRRDRRDVRGACRSAIPTCRWAAIPSSATASPARSWCCAPPMRRNLPRRNPS